MKTVLIVFAFLLIPSFAQAKINDLPAQLRLFGGVQGAEPKELNTNLETLSLDKVDGLIHGGIEASRPFGNHFEVGLRYSVRYHKKGESTDNPLVDYSSELNQNSMMFTARVPIVNTAVFRFETFAAYGGANTTVDVTSATQVGSYTDKKSEWFGHSISSYGAALGVGYKRFYIYIEGGYENNKTGKLTYTGTVSQSVESIDLSGTYGVIGILINGVEPKK
jgi:hypothetical protein